jgi:Uma2 family endonuclease
VSQYPPASIDPFFGPPAWEIAYLFPSQGNWSEDEYLALNTNRLVEFSDGRIEVLPMPTEQHQLVLLYLYEVLKQFILPEKLGTVLVAPLPVKLWQDRIREPDIVFMLAAHKNRRSNKLWKGADLVMEIVSEDDPDRDLRIKRAEYAKAGIPEYWVVDSRHETIAVLVLGKGKTRYTVSGTYRRGQEARSVLLRGFTVAVADVFSQE